MQRRRRTTGRGTLLLCIVFSFTLLTSFAAAGGQKAKKEGAMGGKEEVSAILNVWGYGYKVKVLVNGADVGVKGGMSESKRLFDKNSEMASQATPDIRKTNFVLVTGQNTISVEYTKNGSNPADRVEVTLEALNYPAPVFKLTTAKPSGKVDKTVTILGTAPADFKTVTAD